MLDVLLFIGLSFVLHSVCAARHSVAMPPFLSPQAFGQAYSNQRKVAEDGETNEETLLRESASKEAYYVGRLSELQTEVTLSHSVASNARAENERLGALVQELREVSLSTPTDCRPMPDFFKVKKNQDICPSLLF